MASRRFLTTLARQTSFFFSNYHPHSFHPFKFILSNHLHRLPYIFSSQFHYHSFIFRKFSSRTQNPKSPKFIEMEDNDHSEDDNEDEEEEEDYSSQEEGRCISNEPSKLAERSYFVENKIKEAADIGYKVIGPLQPSDRVFKNYEPVFAVVQVGSHQFKVSNGDYIYVEKLNYCEVNDKLILNKVMMAGSAFQTMIGRPILPDVVVHAVVEEHALDAKVIIFKKKRRKNYRRTKGHRQELTRLRITDIQGVEKPETPPVGKMSKQSSKKVQKVAVAA
ncbi:50S ribosomal protein L21, mitochondrial-like [Amaranthus tricolor]|uniref:50S ribosomal protein L21, mitochondrial-like n=1 Tax=Amaranthus tricolor TaxID=29722 RepID=UPI00258FA6AE|nr:50S ribosomal protein L21, mitochondrial-like [Amaranthus tricolor]